VRGREIGTEGTAEREYSKKHIEMSISLTRRNK
jgi:hypothetical protein